MKIIAINGSPNKNGVTESLLTEIVQSAQQPESLYNLREFEFSPCRGCNACTSNNLCVQKDDWSGLRGPLAEAELLVIGFPTYYGGAFGMNALTHTFLERWYSLRHQGLKMKAKKAIVVISSGEEQADLGLQAIKTFLEAYHGIEVVDYIKAKGATPCYICGYGEACVMSAARAKHGSDVKITKDIIPSLEGQQEVISKARDIGGKIKKGEYR